MSGLCECGCGNPAPLAARGCKRLGIVVGQPYRFISGHNNTRHRMARTSEDQAYRAAKYRCTKPNNSHWKDYGGRGIKFLFTSFEQFFAELGPKPSPQHSLDRYPNNDGNYEPGNVRWASVSEQGFNRRPRKRAA